MQTLMSRDKKRKSHSTVSSQFLLRVAGLPINVVDDLRLEETIQWVNAVLSLETLLAGRKDRVVDMLHEAVNMHKENQKLRRALINLKREIFTMHVARSAQEAQLVADALSCEERQALHEWLNLWKTYREMLKSGSETLSRELSQKRGLLKKIIDTPDFRKGVLLSSSLLDQAVASYLTSDNLQLNREARTVERSLVEYLVRTACKTSPFSTFTSVCIGTFDDGDAEYRQAVTGSLNRLQFTLPMPLTHLRFASERMQQRSFTRLNIVVLSRLSSLILTADEIKHELPICLSPGWCIQGKRVKYVRRKPDVDATDEDALMALDIMHENVLSLPAGQLLQDAIDILKDGREATLGQVVSQLRAVERYRAAEMEVEAYLLRLLHLGFFIVPNLQLDIHSKNPLGEYRKGLLEITTPLTDRLAHELGEVEMLVETYATAPLALRREVLATIKQRLKNCYAELGYPQAALPRTVLYEDTTIRPEKLAINQENWKNVFSDLAELQEVLPVFDTNLSRKLITKGYFRARYGAGQVCDHLLSFAEMFNADYFEQHWKDSIGTQTFDDDGKFKRKLNHFHLPELDMLHDARQAVADYVHDASVLMPEDSAELILDDDFLESLSALVPLNVGDMQSHSFFSQCAQVNEELLLIINLVYPGLTGMFSRFAHCFSEEDGYKLVPALRADLQKLQPGGAVFAELKGGYDATNLNLHPAVTPYELVCPGELSSRPLEEQIPLEDLYIQDDLQEDCLRLYSRRLGKKVIPLYLGFLVPMLLPEIQQVLLNFSPMNRCPLNLWEGTRRARSEDGLVFYPRVRYKHIVLQRAMWKMPVSFIPQRESGQSDADYCLTIARWRKANGVPTRVFFAPVEVYSSTASKDETHKLVRSRKPLYVDFENYFSLSLLEATLRQMTQQVVLSEMLPGRDDLWFDHAGSSHVSEFVFEMNYTKGGRLL